MRALELTGRVADDDDSWIQYNYTTQLWHCCGDHGCSGTPTAETFQAAPPEQFSAVPSGPQSSASASSSSTATTILPSSTATIASASGLSTGAKAGIGVAAAVAVVAIISSIVFFVLWRKGWNARKESPETTWKQEPGLQEQQGVYAGHYNNQQAKHYAAPPEEMAASQTRTTEMWAGRTRTPELSGDELGGHPK